MSQTILNGGTVFDGLGAAGRVADVLIRDGRIVEVADRIGTRARRIDCGGLFVAPGFVDAHSHSDIVPFHPDPQPFKILQGVTTEVVGNCGLTFAPATTASLKLQREAWGAITGGVDPGPMDFASYLKRLADARPLTNFAPLVGHGAIRSVANGLGAPLRSGALERMRRLLDESLEAGAWGFSTGLIYAPGSYAETAELVDLACVVQRHRGLYASHIRDEGPRLEEAVDEALAVGTTSGVRVHISHCKAAGQANHGKGRWLVERLSRARADGADVRGDQYPYTAASTVLSALLPPAALDAGASALQRRLTDSDYVAALRRTAEGGGPRAGLWSSDGPESVVIVGHRDRGAIGRTLTEIAGDGDSWEAMIRLLMDDPGCLIVLRIMDEEDVRTIMASPNIAIGSDAIPPFGLQHPRTWGTFPRLLGTYVRENAVLTWEEAIRKSTSLMAGHVGLPGRGSIVEGAIADVVAFDPKTVGHAGTFANPDIEPVGIKHVLIGGVAVVRDGVATGAAVGRVLRRGRPD